MLRHVTVTGRNDLPPSIKSRKPICQKRSTYGLARRLWWRKDSRRRVRVENRHRHSCLRRSHGSLDHRTDRRFLDEKPRPERTPKIWPPVTASTCAVSPLFEEFLSSCRLRGRTRLSVSLVAGQKSIPPRRARSTQRPPRAAAICAAERGPHSLRCLSAGRRDRGDTRIRRRRRSCRAAASSASLSRSSTASRAAPSHLRLARSTGPGPHRRVLDDCPDRSRPPLLGRAHRPSWCDGSVAIDRALSIVTAIDVRRSSPVHRGRSACRRSPTRALRAVTRSLAGGRDALSIARSSRSIAEVIGCARASAASHAVAPRSSWPRSRRRRSSSRGALAPIARSSWPCRGDVAGCPVTQRGHSGWREVSGRRGLLAAVPTVGCDRMAAQRCWVVGALGSVMQEDRFR